VVKVFVSFATFCKKSSGSECPIQGQTTRTEVALAAGGNLRRELEYAKGQAVGNFFQLRIAVLLIFQLRANGFGRSALARSSRLGR